MAELHQIKEKKTKSMLIGMLLASPLHYYGSDETLAESSVHDHMT